MDFIAVLDHAHLDNALFMKTFARQLAMHRGKSRGIILHGESDYTDRIMQTGVMRDEARNRAIKDLNHRIVALLADEGVPTIGVNGFQRNLLSVNAEQTLTIDHAALTAFPKSTYLVLSNLVHTDQGIKHFSLSNLANAIQLATSAKHLLSFAKVEKNDPSHFSKRLSLGNLSDEERQKLICAEFAQLSHSFYLCDVHQFGEYPSTFEGIYIEAK